jgi:hypothetical protein
VDLREGNIKMEPQETACSTVVWIELNVIKTILQALTSAVIFDKRR